MKRNIEAKFMQLTRNKEKAENFIKGPWNKVLNTNSSKGFQAAWKEMKCTKWCQNPVFMTYLRREWLPCRTKWAHCHTNRVRHFGNTITNRVEPSHSLLKVWLNTSTNKIDSLFRRYHNSIDGQVIEVKKYLEHSRINVYEYAKQGQPYVELNKNVILWAIHLLHADGKKTNACRCFLFETYGIPCRCMVRDVIANGDGVNPGHLDYFWSSLDYLDPRVIRSECEDDEELTRDSLDKLADEACSREEPAIGALIQVVQAHVHPESQNIKEPKDSDAPKGRPPQQSTKRRRTWYEHETTKCSRSNPTTGMLHYALESNSLLFACD
ncbi:hypothetical protein LINGRAHAP2_LOCUS23561 [Linum grandiflorum]